MIYDSRRRNCAKHRRRQAFLSRLSSWMKTTPDYIEPRWHSTRARQRNLGVDWVLSQSRHQTYRTKHELDTKDGGSCQTQDSWWKDWNLKQVERFWDTYDIAYLRNGSTLQCRKTLARAYLKMNSDVATGGRDSFSLDLSGCQPPMRLLLPPWLSRNTFVSPRTCDMKNAVHSSLSRKRVVAERWRLRQRLKTSASAWHHWVAVSRRKRKRAVAERWRPQPRLETSVSAWHHWLAVLRRILSWW